MELDKKSILVVDDVDGVRRELTLLLEEEGYDVDQAANGKEALNFLQEYPIDLVVTDILMPDVDGIILIKEIKEKYPQIKVIAISGGGKLIKLEGEHNYLSSAKLIGANAVLKKPFNSDELLVLVKSLLEE